MSNLTSEELKWIKRVQRALDACPSDRIGFYTVGDAWVSLYDRSKDDEIDNSPSQDFCNQVTDAGADFYMLLNFPNNVHSTAG